MRPALLVICAAVACARAATIPRDLAIIPALETVEIGQNEQKPLENHSSEEELVQQTITVDQVSNDLRSQIAGEVHIPVAIVQDVYPVLKSTAEVNEQKESENEVKPPKVEDIPDEDDEVETPKPGYIQQGIQTLQALQQAATLAVQNALKPQNDEQPASGTGNNLIQQSFDNLQHAVQYGIQSLNQTVANILNGNPDTQSEEGAPNNQNIITTIQHNFQNSLEQFNQTFHNFIHPSDASKPESSSANEQKISQVASELKLLSQQFDVGLKSASDGLQVITSPKQETATSNPTNNNIFQQFFGSWQNASGSLLQNLNATIFNFGQGQTQSDGSGNRPNIFQNIQNIFTGGRPSQALSGESANVTNPTNGFFGPFQNWLSGLQQNQGAGNSSGQPWNVVQQGWQNIQQNIQNTLNFRPQAATGGAAAPPAAAVAAVVDTSSTRTLIASNDAIENAQETVDTPRKKGGGGGDSGDNNDISGGGGVEETAEVDPKPEEAPEVGENVKPADRVVTE